jgi:soluble lytic murein transglycosylase-like protein
MALAARVWVVAVGLLLVAGAAGSEMLVMEAPDGRMLLTNRGARRGYRVISRHREFSGSSAMALYARLGGDPAKYEETVKKTAKRYSLEPSLVKAVIRAESNFDPMAISPKGAMGLMQLMPDTARMHEVRNAFDPSENIHGGARHLRYLMDRYAGKLDLVLAAYNAGTKPVDECRGIPRFAETQEYVRRVRMFQGIYRQNDAKPSLARPVVARADLPASRSKGLDGCGPPCAASGRSLLD